MRKRWLCLSFILLLGGSRLSAQANPLKICVSESGEGYDALRLAGELSSRKMQSGAALAVVAITEKALSAEEERKLANPAAPFVHVLVAEKSAQARDFEVERLGCGYDVKVWYHESADAFDTNSPANLPSAPAPPRGSRGDFIMGDRAAVGYEMRKAGSKKVLVKASAPPLTVFVKQEHRVFNPFSSFADQIVKKLDGVR